MLRLFLFFLIIISGIVLILSMISKSIRTFFSSFTGPVSQSNNNKTKKNKDEIVYQKDDIVVLKGDAGKDKEKNQ
ncbi:MAG: hypothetical protein ABSG15_06110 [FCB group bacterium]|jgi:flagellar basal body-associated protein FliL